MKFKKGDKVEIIGNEKQETGGVCHSHKIGEIGTIKVDDSMAVDVEVETKSQWVEYEDVRKIGQKKSNNP